MDLTGKTIEKHVNGWTDHLLKFTDGTYVKIKAEQGSYDESANVSMTDELDEYELKELGILSEEEFKKRQAEKDQARKKAIELQEYSLYTALKRKYDKTPSPFPTTPVTELP